MTDMLETITNFIREEQGYDGDIDPDLDIMEAHILDSFSIVELAVFIQSELGVELDGEDLNRENFSSLSKIVALIKQREPGS